MYYWHMHGIFILIGGIQNHSGAMHTQTRETLEAHPDNAKYSQTPIILIETVVF